MNQLLARYSYLQLLDLLTTVAFLAHGVQEGNPLVRQAMAATGSPLAGLLLVKLAAMGLGFYCWWSGRGRALALSNVFFALLIVWNLLALILSAMSPAA